ncbi:MAG: SPOR domain-containing protein [Pseudomonadota bacterium]
MKNTLRVITTLLLAVFAGTFIVAIASKKIRQKNIAKKPREPLTEVVITQDDRAPLPVKPLFYTSVGGSNQGAKPEASTNKLTNRYTIEIATLKTQTEADDLLLKLKGRGIDGFYTPTRRGGEVFYRVRLGMFTNQDDAEKTRLKVSQASPYKGTVAKLQ